MFEISAKTKLGTRGAQPRDVDAPSLSEPMGNRAFGAIEHLVRFDHQQSVSIASSLRTPCVVNGQTTNASST